MVAAFPWLTRGVLPNKSNFEKHTRRIFDHFLDDAQNIAPSLLGDAVSLFYDLFGPIFKFRFGGNLNFRALVPPNQIPKGQALFLMPYKVHGIRQSPF